MDSFKVAYCEPKSKAGEVPVHSAAGGPGLERTIASKDLRTMSAVDATDHGSAKTGARGFATDENIASSNTGIKNRAIVSASQTGWVQSQGDSALDAPLEGGGRGIGKFDQFKTNEEKFGVKSTYDETLYTTALNRSDFTREQQQKAAEIEKAILSGEGSSLKGNIHVLEERGIQSWADQMDEEARHSAVIRDPHQAALMSGTTTAPATGQSPNSNRFGNNNNNNRSQDFRGGGGAQGGSSSYNQQRQGSHTSNQQFKHQGQGQGQYSPSQQRQGMQQQQQQQQQFQQQQQQQQQQQPTMQVGASGGGKYVPPNARNSAVGGVIPQQKPSSSSSSAGPSSSASSSSAPSGQVDSSNPTQGGGGASSSNPQQVGGGRASSATLDHAVVLSGVVARNPRLAGLGQSNDRQLEERGVASRNSTAVSTLDLSIGLPSNSGDSSSESKKKLSAEAPEFMPVKKSTEPIEGDLGDNYLAKQQQQQQQFMQHQQQQQQQPMMSPEMMYNADARFMQHYPPNFAYAQPNYGPNTFFSPPGGIPFGFSPSPVGMFPPPLPPGAPQPVYGIQQFSQPQMGNQAMYPAHMQQQQPPPLAYHGVNNQPQMQQGPPPPEFIHQQNQMQQQQIYQQQQQQQQQQLQQQQQQQPQQHVLAPPMPPSTVSSSTASNVLPMIGGAIPGNGGTVDGGVGKIVINGALARPSTSSAQPPPPSHLQSTGVRGGSAPQNQQQINQAVTASTSAAAPATSTETKKAPTWADRISSNPVATTAVVAPLGGAAINSDNIKQPTVTVTHASGSSGHGHSRGGGGNRREGGGRGGKHNR